ncbi:MAG: hypothetical protein MOGMAGMI_00164 [Candidatus Omnitrophica bacterium]|nr:hypothetical protein [Candidatus Omnitrophota bacterium]
MRVFLIVCTLVASVHLMLTPALAAVPLGPAEEPTVELSPAPAGPNLYERLGGESAIAAVVEDFVARAAADPAVNFTRKGTPREWQPTPDNLLRLKKRLVEMLAAAAGGPDPYAGRSMKEVHRGMGITGAEYDAIVVNFKRSLDELNIALSEQVELLALVGTLRSDIVES